MATSRDDRASVDQLRLGNGFPEAERDEIVGRLRKLDRRLKRFNGDAVDLELSVKDRDGNDQQVTLEARLPKMQRIVVTSRKPAMKDALMEVRNELWRRIDTEVDKMTVERHRP
ncbi:MAG: HPF/RaiA family ribosome-associated protein [Actinomycetota bacterium]|nr:HPF/RaiA family ribosome-associated protein [Actinomycetota bacterium]